MRNALLQLGLVMIGVMSVHAVRLLQTSSLHARVFPAGAAEQMIAIQGKDSIRMAASSEGDFYLTTANPGHWQLLVNARAPYRDANLEVRDVKPGSDIDLGEIVLERAN